MTSTATRALSRTAAIKAAARRVSLVSMGSRSYDIYSPYDWDDIDGPTNTSAPAGDWFRARVRLTHCRATLALHLMGYDTTEFDADNAWGCTTVEDFIAHGVKTLPRRF